MRSSGGLFAGRARVIEPMPATKPIPIRFENQFIHRLDAAAARMGRNRAAVIRFCVSTFVDHVERHGSSMMPPDWPSLVGALRKADPAVAEAVVNSRRPAAKKRSANGK
jgi:hypothetical protein